jgi:hypothetical protein
MTVRDWCAPAGVFALRRRYSRSGDKADQNHEVEPNGLPRCCLSMAPSVRAAEEIRMKFMLLPTAVALSIAAGWVAAPAHAAGCLKGAAVGGVAGHLAGHHGVLGAGAGCIVVHHEATKAAREKTRQQQSGSSSDGLANSNPGR